MTGSVFLSNGRRGCDVTPSGVQRSRLVPLETLVNSAVSPVRLGDMTISSPIVIWKSQIVIIFIRRYFPRYFPHVLFCFLILLLVEKNSSLKCYQINMYSAMTSVQNKDQFVQHNCYSSCWMYGWLARVALRDAQANSLEPHLSSSLLLLPLYRLGRSDIVWASQAKTNRVRSLLRLLHDQIRSQILVLISPWESINGTNWAALVGKFGCIYTLSELN